MKLTLDFRPSSERPTVAQDGMKFLLCWGGWQYSVCRWGAERNDFYHASGDYLCSWENPFVWAQLPDNLK
jgi:hypothetical protein